MMTHPLFPGIAGTCSGRLSRFINRSIIGFAFAALTVAPALGLPPWYDSGTQSGIQPGSPDFYQHQVNEDPAYVNGGFCAYFAFEDAMYYDANNGFPNLYANNANWVNGMINNFQNILNTPVTGTYSTTASYLNATYNSYITAQGYGMSLGSTSTGNSGAGYSAFNVIQQDLLAGSNTLIFMGPGSTNQWWGFHVMDVVGFNASNHTLIALDPDNNRYGGYGYPGTNTSPPSSGYYTNRFGVPVPYSLAFYNTNEPMPIESGFGDLGGPTNSLLQSYTVDAGGDITSGIYADTYISSIFAIGPVPEPSSIALGVVAAATFGAYRRVRRKKRLRNGLQKS